jgi:predicted ribosomally synthesized peptide with SipW-like signal peptide
MRKIIMSLVMIALLSAGTVGATRAYFSDTALSENNTFSTGKLDIRISRPGNAELPFSVTDMEPGKSVTKYLTVVNDGNIDVKWRAYISGGDGGNLFNALRITNVTMYPDDYDGYDELTAAGYTIAGSPNLTILDTPTPFSSFLAANNGLLVWDQDEITLDPFKPKWAATYAFTVEMDPNAGNNYQGSSWSGTLAIYATQELNSGW